MPNAGIPIQADRIERVIIPTEQSEFDARRDAALRCAQCQVIFQLAPCPNCGCPQFERGFSQLQAGLVCRRCYLGFARWICPACRHSNATRLTAVHLVFKMIGAIEGETQD